MILLWKRHLWLRFPPFKGCGGNDPALRRPWTHTKKQLTITTRPGLILSTHHAFFFHQARSNFRQKLRHIAGDFAGHFRPGH